MASSKSRGTSASTGTDAFMDGTEREVNEVWPGKEGEVGSAILGKLDSVEMIATKLSKNGERDTPLFTFSPVIMRHKDGEMEVFRALAVIGSASLRLRIKAADAGRFFALKYDGREKTDRGDMHVFTVVEKTRTQFADMLAKTDAGDDLPF